MSFIFGGLGLGGMQVRAANRACGVTSLSIFGLLTLLLPNSYFLVFTLLQRLLILPS